MKTFAVAAGIFITAYVVFRLIGGVVFRRRVAQELDDVLRNDEFRIKGRFE